MGQQVDLNLLRRFDPLAVSSLVQDRATYHLLKRMLDVTVAALALVVLSPLLVLIAMIVIMDKYRIFDAILVLTKMNPVYGADTLMLYNWRIAVEVQRLGKANAMSVLTVVGIVWLAG